MDKKQVVVNSKSGFDQFCELCLKNLDADKRDEIIHSSLNSSVMKILDDAILCDSIKSFFDNNLNVSETSRTSFIHRNTLVYRLDKILKITGLDIRNFEDAVCFRLYMWLNENK